MLKAKRPSLAGSVLLYFPFTWETLQPSGRLTGDCILHSITAYYKIPLCHANIGKSSFANTKGLELWQTQLKPFICVFSKSVKTVLFFMFVFCCSFNLACPMSMGEDHNCALLWKIL